MSAPRRFDHDEARARHQAGESIASLAREYGVTWMAVYLVVNDDARAAQRERHSAWQRRGTCPDCGGPSTRHARNQSRRCAECANDAKVTSVRADTLRCATCHEWKPDKEFPLHATEARRRGRHGTCRSCHTRIKRRWRARLGDDQRERLRAYDRERKRARRAAA